jgi:hypothetical protein
MQRARLEPADAPLCQVHEHKAGWLQARLACIKKVPNGARRARPPLITYAHLLSWAAVLSASSAEKPQIGIHALIWTFLSLFFSVPPAQSRQVNSAPAAARSLRTAVDRTDALAWANSHRLRTAVQLDLQQRIIVDFVGPV